MAPSDSPLKQLVSAFITDFAAWLLQAEVSEARPLNVELPTAPLTADQVFQVTLSDGRVLVLHLEFQGRRSPQPMAWRMLEYMARLAGTHRVDLWSVVFYVGRGAGADDPGQYQVQGPAGTPSLAWSYQVIRLWQMPAEALEALGRVALLPLVGQTQMASPEVVLPRVVARLRRVPEAESRGRLLTALLALMQEEEMVTMVERLLEDDAVLVDTPYLRRIRSEGREEGREEGRQEGELRGRRRGIIEALRLRFDLPEAVTDQMEHDLETLSDASRLEALFAAAIQRPSLAEFQTALAQARRS